MNRTECCKHHLCGGCASEIMERIPAFRAGYEETGTVREAKAAPCPHCGAENLRLSKIRNRDEARSYSDSPAVMNRTRGHTPGRGPAVQASPLKVGDSMENMMRKMLTYEQCGINIKAEQRITVVGDTTTPGRDSPPLCDRELDANNLPHVPFPPLPEDRPAHHAIDVAPVPAPERRVERDGDGTPALSPSGSGGAPLMSAVDMRGRLAGLERERSEGGAPGRPPLHGSRTLGGSRSRSISPLPPVTDTHSLAAESARLQALPAAPVSVPLEPPAAPVSNIAWCVEEAPDVGAGGASGEDGRGEVGVEGGAVRAS